MWLVQIHKFTLKSEYPAGVSNKTNMVIIDDQPTKNE